MKDMPIDTPYLREFWWVRINGAIPVALWADAQPAGAAT
jgi:hypothetical protein